MQTHAGPDLADLTRRYARYSRSAGGMASVLGGAFAVLAYAIGTLAAPDAPAPRIGLALLPLIWIVSKEMLRVRYYQRFGRVAQRLSTGERRWHLGFTLFTLAISVVIIGTIVHGLTVGPRSLADDPWVAGYLAWIAAMPVLVWYFMRTPLEFIVGVFLMAQAALALVGVYYSVGQQLQAPIAGLVLMVIGVREHLEFRSLHREIVAVSGS